MIVRHKGVAGSMAWEQFYHFGEDGTYKTIFTYGIGPATVGWWFKSGSAGTYTYSLEENGETATLALTDAEDGLERVYELGFIYEDFPDLAAILPFELSLSSFNFQPIERILPLSNVSIRINVHPSEIGILGFVVEKRSFALVRAVGPALSNFDVSPILEDPNLTVFDSDENIVAEQDDWEINVVPKEVIESVSEFTGAFGLSPGSKDSAYLDYFEPGVYTAHCRNNSENAGEVLLEVYVLPNVGRE